MAEICLLNEPRNLQFVYNHGVRHSIMGNVISISNREVYRIVTDAEIMDYLLKNNVNLCYIPGEYLQYACSIAEADSINVIMPYANNDIHKAIRSVCLRLGDRVDLLELLINYYGIDKILSNMPYEITPEEIMSGEHSQNVEIVKKLIEIGIEYDQCGLFIIALFCGDIDIVDYLVKKCGFDIDPYINKDLFQYPIHEHMEKYLKIDRTIKWPLCKASFKYIVNHLVTKTNLSQNDIELFFTEICKLKLTNHIMMFVKKMNIKPYINSLLSSDIDQKVKNYLMVLEGLKN
jgi:hypothetical protein